MKARAYSKTAWSISGLAAVMGGLSLVLLAINRAGSGADVYDHWLADAVVAVAFPAVGALIVSRQPSNKLGWVLCVIGLALGVARFSSEYANYTLITEPGALPGGVAAAWLNSWATYVGFLSLPFVPLLFPDGRPPSRRWRSVAWLTAGVVALAAVSYAFMPGPLDEHPAIQNPFGIPGTRPFFELLVGVAAMTFLLCLIAGVLSLILRFSRSQGDKRQQLKWLAYAAALLPATYVVNDLLPDLQWLVGGISSIFIPAAIAVAILKYRLYDIDLVINRTLVYGALTACVVGLYVLVVGGLGTLLQARSDLLVSLIGAGLVAVLFAPLRDRLQRGVNRLMYGERGDPYAVLSGLGQRLESTLAPAAVLPAVVRTVREALKLPYVAIEVEREGVFETAATAGEPVDDPERLPLVYGGETVGRLTLGLRYGEEGFAPADRRLLEDLARQIGVAVHAARVTGEAIRLSKDLQRSRERLVAAREEERRRLRRDLHDGLGPRLAGLTMRAEAARDLIPEDPARAEALLKGLIEGAQDAVADIRRLVHGLRPPALDALGLTGALRAHATHGEHGGPRFTIEVPESLPPLPAAVEVAAYRIALEAMNNAVRHSGARNGVVRLTFDAEDGALRLEVTDDGRGIGGNRGTGVGLHSMRERAGELGGELEVENLPSGGARVRAYLPRANGAEPTRGPEEE